MIWKNHIKVLKYAPYSCIAKVGRAHQKSPEASLYQEIHWAVKMVEQINHKLGGLWAWFKNLLLGSIK